MGRRRFGLNSLPSPRNRRRLLEGRTANIGVLYVEKCLACHELNLRAGGAARRRTFAQVHMRTRGYVQFVE